MNIRQLMINALEIFFIKKPYLRRAITRLCYGERDVCVNLLGAELLINSAKENGLFRAWKMSRYSSLLRDELPVLITLAGLLRDGDFFIDVGANVGIYTLVFERLRAVYSRFDLCAFEAHPETFKRLEQSCRKRGIACYNVALSDKEGELDFYEGAVSHVFITVDNASAYSIRDRVITVPSRRLDSYELNSNSLVIKIDVEGQEMAVLRGFSKFLEDGRVRIVYLDGYRNEEIVDYLKGYGFHFYNGRTLEPSDGRIFQLLAIKTAGN